MALTMIPLSIQEATATTVDVADLTSGKIGGTGVFDILMTVVSKHIQEEYNKNRITGKEYATVYIGAVNAVLQQAVQFLSIGQQVEKLNAEIGLLRQKTVTELAQTDNDIPAGLGFNNDTVVAGSIAKQKDLLTAQTTGFTRDAEQKILKAFLDTWAVRRTTDEGTTTPSNIADTAINAVAAKAAAGIGVSV